MTVPVTAPALAIPTVHLNGTSRQELLDQLITAGRAGREFTRALGQAAPNGRDYYLKAGSTYPIAHMQHLARLAKVQEVIKELETIAEAIAR